MALKIHTAGEIVLPDGTKSLGVILTSTEKQDVKNAARHWDEPVKLAREE